MDENTTTNDDTVDAEEGGSALNTAAMIGAGALLGFGALKAVDVLKDRVHTFKMRRAEKSMDVLDAPVEDAIEA